MLVSVKAVSFIFISCLVNTSTAFLVGRGYTTSRTSLSVSRDSLEPVSINGDLKKFSSAVVPFLATLLVSRAVLAADALVEPTAEFKEEIKKAADLKAQQQKIRNAWDVIMTKLLAATEPETTEQCLKDLNGILVRYNNGIPSGVKKIEMVRSIRSMKYVQVGKKQKPLPTWSKGSEIAYQILIQEFNRQVAPNNREARTEFSAP